MIAIQGDGNPFIEGIRAPHIERFGRVVFVSTPCAVAGFFTECVWSWDEGLLALWSHRRRR